MKEIYSSSLNSLLGLLTNTHEQTRKSACDLASNRTPLVLHLPDLINNGAVSKAVSNLFKENEALYNIMIGKVDPEIAQNVYDFLLNDDCNFARVVAGAESFIFYSTPDNYKKLLMYWSLYIDLDKNEIALLMKLATNYPYPTESLDNDLLAKLEDKRLIVIFTERVTTLSVDGSILYDVYLKGNNHV